MNKTIKLKANTFKYPTKKERIVIRNSKIRIPRFNVEYKSATLSLLNDSTFEVAIKDEDLYWWCNCVNNRIGNLEETYTYVLTHYLRHDTVKHHNCEDIYTDKLLLNYYIEIFYYYFFSTRDVIGQLLNIYFGFGILENKLFLNKDFVEKIKSKDIKKLLKDFLENTKDSYNIRNSFNHRFTPINQDHRAKTNIIKEKNVTKFYPAKKIETKTFLKDIENLIKQLNLLMKNLVKIIN